MDLRRNFNVTSCRARAGYCSFRCSPLPYFARHGDISYGVSLYAFPVQQLLVLRFPHVLIPLTLFLPCTFLLAALSWCWVERPFLTRKRPASPGADATAADSGIQPAQSPV